MISSPKHILVIRFSSIGDIVLTFPLLRMLKNKFPNAGIDFVVKTQYAELVEKNPFVDALYRFDKKDGWFPLLRIRKAVQKQDYDLIVDLQSNFRSFVIKVFQNARVVSYKKPFINRLLLVLLKYNRFTPAKPVYQRYIDTLHASEKAEPDFIPDRATCVLAASRLTEQGFQQRELNIAFIPGAGKATKRWPADYYAQLGGLLSRQPLIKIWVLGDEGDREPAAEICRAIPGRCIDLTGKFSLMESACALSKMDAVVSNDSGFMHIADALQKPVIAIFGPTTGEFGFYPRNANARVIECKDLYCRPCSHVGPDRCPEKHFRCMRDIKPEVVYNRIVEDILPITGKV
ncbi:lipopolysaccharide heptosyltransferase II [candidate division KSB1 bacterium]|nr:lipopolysaccharide heptosyltransferase II [candidate division KSB1 bacterium]